MSRIFDSSNPLMRILGSLFDCVCLSVLWALFTLPVFTAGAAATAMYETVYRYFVLDEGYLFRSFRESFCKDFKRSTCLWGIAAAITAVMAVDMWGLYALGFADGGLGKLLWLMQIIFAVLILGWFVFVFSYAARFEGSVSDVLKTSFLMMLAHPIYFLPVVLPTIAGAFVLYYFPLLFVVIPTLCCRMTCDFTEIIFRCHLPDDTEQ